MAETITIKSKDPAKAMERKYEDLKEKLFADLQVDSLKMMANPNFQRFIIDISDDVERTDPDTVVITQPTENVITRADEPIYNRYCGPLSVNGRRSSDYALPAYFDTKKELLSFAYFLAQRFGCQAVSVSEISVDYLGGIRDHLFASPDDFKEYLNDTFGYRKETKYRSSFVRPVYAFQLDSFLNGLWDLLFSDSSPYHVIERNYSGYLPVRFILYRRYAAPSWVKEEKPSWH
ncbi:MAG: hypothetical protein K2L38_05655 [Dysosmobacter sp.]|nr:hypothetical protein [Dysosmobacter sp.]